ncbi:MAG: BMP family ABC transporter substrate-binding protein [Anaerolineae bacterium]|nr:BMP family ABC transporter substrate-binding protein [Anaerolineae bacterium]
MNRVHRLFACTLLLALVLTLGGPALAQDECTVKIGLVTDVGRLNDQSFNESAWKGIQAAAEQLGLGEECYNYIETQDTADYIPNIELFIDEGYNVIITSGYLMTSATREAGLLYPDVYFIGTDQDQTTTVMVQLAGAAEETAVFVYDPIPNVAGLVFDESVAGFLAGALAGQMTESNVIAGVYGTDIVPPVPRFGMGYEQGAKYVNPDVEVKAAYHPGTPDVAFVDAQWGSETAQTMLNEGADVIFAAGGTTGNGGLIAGCTAGYPVIGVDFDQYYTVTEVQSCIITSATKDLVNGVRDLILAVADDTFVGGNVFGPAGLAPFHDWEEKIPDEVKAKVEEIKGMIAAGEIETCPVDDEKYGAACIMSGLGRGLPDAAMVMSDYCSACHDAERIETNVAQGLDWWTTTLETMMSQDGGPELTADDVKVILQYVHQ